MKFHRFLLSVVCLAATCSLAQAQSRNFIVLSGTQGSGSTAFASKLGATVTANLPKFGVVMVSSADPNFVSKAKKVAGVSQVSADPEFQWINKEPNQFADSTPADNSLPANHERFSAYQWNLRVIGADQTAANNIRGKGARVAVLDSGMDLNNPDLKPNIDASAAKSFACYDGAPNGCETVQPTGLTKEGAFNHGTHVGGIIAAAVNGWGVQGVAPEATLVPIKVLRESGSGSFGWLIQGLAYAETQQIDVANMSLGATFLRNPNVDCTTTAKDCNAGTLMAALNRAINHATASGILSVISAGNDGVDLNSQWVSIPAQSGNGIAVSATGPLNQQNFDRLASYSNYGQSVVSIAAPGGEYVAGNVLDYVLSDGLCDASGSCPFFFAVGTSMAAPHVSGVAALVVGQRGHIGPSELRSILLDSSVDILKPGADPAGKGRVSAVNATK